MDAGDVAEEVPTDDDAPMDSDSDDGTDADFANNSDLGPNDAWARFDDHDDSIFSVACHPVDKAVYATGSGDNTFALFSLHTVDDVPSPDSRLQPLYTSPPLSESVASLAFSLPRGDFILAADLNGLVRAHPCPRMSAANLRTDSFSPDEAYQPSFDAQEVDEVAWLLPAPSPPAAPNSFAYGAADGSVWTQRAVLPGRMELLQTYYRHADACTAGAFAPNGRLATVSSDGSLYVHAPFADDVDPAAPLVALTAGDARFAVDGGLNSVAFNAAGTLVAAGGPGGQVRVVSVPAGQLVAVLNGPLGDDVETLAWSPPAASGPALLAAGAVNGGIAVWDVGRNFALRGTIQGAHGAHAVVQVAFDGDGTAGGGPAGTGNGPWMLTSCGMDGVVRRWDPRGGAAAGAGAAVANKRAWAGLVREDRGQRGGGEKGGVLGFVRAGDKIVTAGDDGIALIFNVPDSERT